MKKNPQMPSARRIIGMVVGVIIIAFGSLHPVLRWTFLPEGAEI